MKDLMCESCKRKSLAANELTQSQIENLSESCLRLEIKAGENIFRQNSHADNVIYIKQGLAKIHIIGPQKEQIVKIIKGPVYLGLPAVFHGDLNQYSATALTKSKVCVIKRETFKQFIFENGKFAYEILVDLCSNEIEAYTKCVNRVQKQTRGRIAEVLLAFYEKFFNSETFELPLTRDEIGNLTDTARETVSRVFTEFSQDKIIELQNRKITILDFEKLRMISEKG